MNILIAGGTGFLGAPLVNALAERGHRVVVLSRGSASKSSAFSSSQVRRVAWVPDGSTGAWARELDDADAVINLGGAGIADKRWTAARKRELLDSRLRTTRSLVTAIRGAVPRPRAFISGSAIGYYGTSDTDSFIETSSRGTDFLADVCAQWESTAQEAANPNCRVVFLRTGVVLARDGGALKKMMLPFLLFAGGPVGSGKQWMSWIHRDDWIRLVERLLTDTSFSGPINAVAPSPVTNRDFSSALGRAVHRPSWLPAPGFMLRAIFGEMADVILLSGQRVLPSRAGELGFEFTYADLDRALQHV